MKSLQSMILAGLLAAFLSSACAEDAQITIQADQVINHISPNMATGACLEDVNHEIYGGLYSQMIFGESFQEPAAAGLPGFQSFGSGIELKDGVVTCAAEPATNEKLVWDGPVLSKGKVSVEVLRPSSHGGVAGLILDVDQAGKGMDGFNGYEISLNGDQLILGRHRHNWEPIATYPCPTPPDQWTPIEVQVDESGLTISVNGQVVATYRDADHPLPPGKIGLRSVQGGASFRNFSFVANDTTTQIPFTGYGDSISGTWNAIRLGSATGTYDLVKDHPFLGGQSQAITFTGGEGEIGIANASLNGWGMNFQASKNYKGCLWAKSENPTELFVCLESGDGSKVYAEQKLSVPAGDWQKIDFTITPNTTDTHGRFAIKLKSRGSVTLGYAFLQPDSWGLFHDLPVRKDVVQGLIDQGVTVLRYGGTMINAPDYHWKNMIGPRDRRPPYDGHWYPYSTNGWGIFDFLNMCEAAGFVGIPVLNSYETPRDMADFIEYVNGPSSSEWGGKRAADGHEEPYNLKYFEFGNEERIDDAYWQRFQTVAKAVWAADPDIIIVVGDLNYHQPIQDPMSFHGSDAGITSLAAHQKILDFARQNDREVWFDVHINTDGPGASDTLVALPTFVSALNQVANGARFKVVVFELNANNHDQRRALGNAVAANAISRITDPFPVVTSANCLQPDGQNINGWDQGLLFLNPSQVWLQPPGYVTQMLTKNFQPLLVTSQVTGSDHSLDVTAKRSEDGKTLVLQVVNLSDQPVLSAIHLSAFNVSIPNAKAIELAGPLNSVNTAQEPKRLVPSESDWPNKFTNGSMTYTFKPNSFTILTFQ